LRFDDVVGHEPQRALLARAVASRRLPPALLFTGPEGVGKKTLALVLARAALCAEPVAEGACGACHVCRVVDKETARLPEARAEADRRVGEGAETSGDQSAWRNFRLHPDLVLTEAWHLTKAGRRRVEPTIRVEQVRELIREIAATPFEAARRVFIVDEAHAMNESSQNALLKSLEEPPPRSHVILVTEAPHGLLPTIRSRCQHVRFGPLPLGALERHLREAHGLEPDEARLRAVLAAGSLGTALELQSDVYRARREQVLAVLEGPGDASVFERLEAGDRLAEAEDLGPALAQLRGLLRDLLALRSGAPPERLLNRDLAERLAPLARSRLGARAGTLAEAVGRAEAALRGNANRLLTLDVLLGELAAASGAVARGGR
jgi:DNA polymerase-3 subunit delta'